MSPLQVQNLKSLYHLALSLNSSGQTDNSIFNYKHDEACQHRMLLVIKQTYLQNKHYQTLVDSSGISSFIITS